MHMPQWRSRSTLVFALTASALGLGNFWRFPFLVGEHGGAPFMLAYVAFLCLAMVPLLIAELVVGRNGRGSPLISLAWAAERARLSRSGAIILGFMLCGVALGVLLLLTLTGAWGLAYFVDHLGGAFIGMPLGDVARHFAALINAPLELLAWQTAFLLPVLAVSALGVKRGLGIALWIAIPLLLFLLSLLLLFSFANGDLAATDRYLFADAGQEFRQRSLFVAMQHALYTLGVGMGVGMTLAAYAPSELPLGRTVMAVAVLDTAVGLAAALIIVPLVLGGNLQMIEGPGLLFVVLPHVLGGLVGGDMAGLLLFAAVSLVGFVSALMLLEPLVVVLLSVLQWQRWRVVIALGAVVWVLSAVLMLTFTALPGFASGGSASVRWLDAMLFKTLLPLGLIGLLLLVGWYLPMPVLRGELRRESTAFFLIWLALLRYVAPPTIAIIMLAGWMWS